MTDILTFSRYVRTPFVVEAVEITADNIEEIAKQIGEVREKDGEKYIAIDRRVVPNIGRAFIGWFFTRMEDNYRCYSPRIFKDQFVSVEGQSEINLKLDGDVVSA